MVNITNINKILIDKLSGASGPDFLLYDKVSSTNDVLKDIVTGSETSDVIITDEIRNKAKEGFSVISLAQTKGKGRSGRSFFSPSDCSIYLSILVKPNISVEDSLLITPMAAVAVHDAIREICGIEAGIKWVNDLYINNRKICGILTEGSVGSSRELEYAIIGIGINVYMPAEPVPEELKDVYGTIFDSDTATDECILGKLMVSVIKNTLRYYGEINERTFINQYRDAMFLKGMKVIYVSGNDETEVVVKDVDNDMRLVVIDANNKIHHLKDGEVRLKLLLN